MRKYPGNMNSTRWNEHTKERVGNSCKHTHMEFVIGKATHVGSVLGREARLTNTELAQCATEMMSFLALSIFPGFKFLADQGFFPTISYYLRKLF